MILLPLVTLLPLLPLAMFILWTEIEEEVGDYVREVSF